MYELLEINEDKKTCLLRNSLDCTSRGYQLNDDCTKVLLDDTNFIYVAVL